MSYGHVTLGLMSNPLSAATLLRIFDQSGVSYVTRAGWATHNRGQRGDGWGETAANPTGVHGVIVHHTGEYDSTSGILDYLWDGDGDLPGPLCLAGVDKKGVLHMTGCGRANHAGTGDPVVLQHVIREDYTVLPAPRFANGQPGGVDGNARFYGFECLNQGDGKDPWPEVQVEAVAKACAAICRAHGWTERSVIGHKEWQRGKVDPTFDMHDFRARVRKHL